jgi:hypothetical protein
MLNGGERLAAISGKGIDIAAERMARAYSENNP